MRRKRAGFLSPGWFLGATVALAVTLSTATAAHAQETGTVEGTVVDAETGEPVGGAQVHLTETDQGSLAAPDGSFTLENVPAGEHTVRAQNFGYQDAEETVTVVGGETVTVELALVSRALDVEGLVVTALGVTREERELGYAVQSVGREAIEDMPTVNVAQALQGRAAGVQVNRTSSRPGGSSRVVIRGESSFTGGGQPLWVVDGVPIQMETDAQGTFGPEGGEAGSRSMDIDMNDVEEISVLRGAAATALYGSRAAHGAVIIQTQQGEAGAPTQFTLNTRYRATRPMLEGFQETYTAGRTDPETGEAYYCNGLPEGYGGWCEPGYYEAGFSSPTTWMAWGPRYDEISQDVMDRECPGVDDPADCLRLRDPRKDFYQTGHMAETSLSARGGLGESGNFNIRGSFLNEPGIEPNTSLERTNLSANLTLELTDRLQSNTNVRYANTHNVWGTEGWLGIERELWYLTPNLDTRDAWEDDGSPVMWGGNSPHPEWRALNEEREGTTDRWITAQNFTFDISERFTLQNRTGFDTYVERRTSQWNERPWLTAEGIESGASRQERHRRMTLDNDLMLNMATTPITSDISVSGLAGFNVLARQNDRIVGQGTDIVIPGYYNLENFMNQNVWGDLAERRRLVGLYGQATVDYQDWAYLNLTARNDWSSTLPLDDNNYFYPSAAFNLIFTDAFDIDLDWLNYGKIRASAAKVGSDAPPYRLRTTYSSGGRVQWPFNNTLGFLQSSSLGNPELRPESTTEYEVGLELRGIDDRARLDLSYYDKRSYDQIFSVPSSAATGYSSITRNAGDLRNKGWEASLDLVPVQTPDARWNVNLNWTRNRSMVEELAPGVTSIHLAGYAWPSVQIREGEEYGVIWGEGWTRTEDGEPLIDDDPDSDTYGWPVLDDELQPLGNMQHSWDANLGSSFTYGPFTVSGLVNHVQGGDVFNFTLNYTIGRGVHSWTEERGTAKVYEGVKASTVEQTDDGSYVGGEPNDIEIERDANYYQNQLGGYLRNENYVEDGTHTRLQELSVRYRLPERLMNRLGVDQASLYATGHNLYIWSDFSFVDPQGSNYGDTNAGGTAYHMFVEPPIRSYTFGVRANF